MKSSLGWELKKAQKYSYAVPAFNFDNLEMLKAIIKAAEIEDAPVIIMATEGAVNYMGEDLVVAIGKTAMENAKIPVVLHWDHGQTFSQGCKLLDGGFVSLMIDVSQEAKWFNIQQTKKLVDYAHQRGFCVESEIGHVGGEEDGITSDKNLLTKVADAVEFVTKTDVDALAISVGTTHGVYKAKPNIDFELIKKIKSKIPTPLVLHGGSGLSDSDLNKAIDCGITKVNIGTDLKILVRNSLEDFFKNHPNTYDMKKIGKYIMDQIIQFIRHKISVCRATGQASLKRE